MVVVCVSPHLRSSSSLHTISLQKCFSCLSLVFFLFFSFPSRRFLSSSLRLAGPPLLLPLSAAPLLLALLCRGALLAGPLFGLPCFSASSLASSLPLLVMLVCLSLFSPFLFLWFLLLPPSSSLVVVVAPGRVASRTSSASTPVQRLACAGVTSVAGPATPRPHLSSPPLSPV